MMYRQLLNGFHHSCKWFAAASLLAVGAGVQATPVSVPDESFTANEEQFVRITIDLSTKFSDPTALHSIASYAFLGSAGDSITSVSMAGNLAHLDLVANAYGTATYTFQATDNFTLTDTYNFTLTLNPVNDAPSFTAGSNQTVLEDAGAQTVNSWATAISAGPNEATQTVSFNVTNDNNGLFSAQPVVDSSGNLTYTPATDANGSATVTIAAQDNGGTANGGIDTSPDQTFTITVTAVNDVPGFTAGGDETVAEDSGAQTVSGWASGLSAGPADESGQVLNFNVTGNTNAGLFSAAPAVDPISGDLTFTPAGNATGSADITLELSDNGGTANGGVDTSAPQTFTITVDGVNDVPSFSNGGDVTVLEDSGGQTVAGWATALSAGPPDESAQLLSFNITSNSNAALFTSAPAVDGSTGDLTFTVAADVSGSATITLNVQDNGGTANGGVDTSGDQSFTITVDPVNDVPGFTSGGNVTVLEDAGSQTVVAWASALVTGPADESGQSLNFNVVSNSNPGLFATPPAVDGTSGDLTFAAAGDVSGTATITLNVQDDGGTADGGVDTSATQSFDIVVTAVNDAPSFTAGPNQSVDEDAGPQTVAGWATGITAGPADESGQLLTFNVVSNSNAALFSVLPAVDATTGDLTYTPAADVNGTAIITLELSDNGGVADGGVDTSGTQSFNIAVGDVNDQPGFTGGGNVTVLEDAGAQIIAAWASGLTAGPPDESGQTLTFNVVSNSNPALFSALPMVDGTTGDLTFTTAGDVNGTATITLNVQDDGGTANGGVDTSLDQSFDIVLTAVNDAPSFSAGPNQNVAEDAGAQTVTGWATGISAGPADESGQTLTFNVVSNSNPALFTVLPTVDATTGDLTYTPAADVNGTATINLELSDNGGVADGGANTSAVQSFTITIADVNDAPSFVAGGDQTLLEDADPVVVPGWATGLSAGPGNEATQVLSFNLVANTNPALFASLPFVDGSTGDLTFTLAANANGTATITLNVSDDGGTSNGGTDTSPNQSFTVDVTEVNDAPVFTVGPNIGVAEDAGPQTMSGWATGMSPGPADEAGQTLTFNVVGNTNAAMFSALPAVDPVSGDLTFTAAPDANGVATITLNLSDDGGTANGGEDTSADQTFEIVVTGVNDMPVADDDGLTMVEDGGPVLIPVLDNDYLAEEPTSIIQAGVDGYSESAPTTVLNQVGDPVTEPNGQVSVVGNAIEYEPKPDFYGDDYFTYSIRDVNGDVSTATVRVTVTPQNDPPVGIQERSFTMLENGTLSVDASTGLLVGAYDVDGALLDASGEPLGATISLQVTAFPTIGSLSINQTTGTFDYTPPVDFTGEVVFEYRLTDGSSLSTGDAYRVRVVVLEAPEPPAPPPAGQVSITYELANVPLENTSSVPPNVLVVMDDSGSMDWHMIVSGTDENGGFVLDNASRANSGKRSTSYVYLWDLKNNAYPPTSGNGGILPTEAALTANGKTTGNEYGVWRARTHLHNKLYYNPNITYTPWTGQDATNAEFANANPSAIRLDPVDPTNLFNMLALHSYKSSSVPEWDNNGGTENVDVNNVYIPHYYATTATPPLAWNSPRTLVEIKAGAGPLAGGLFPGSPQREDCALDDGNPLTCTYAQEIQNFANYFQYYRSREYVTKNGIGKVVAQLQDIRVGYETISNTTSKPVREMNRLYTEGDKKILMDNIYAVDSYGGTPLRQALGRAGDIFSCNTGNDCPALSAPEGFCQQNFALLFSDGYWNGGTGVSGNRDDDGSGPFDGGRYADDVDATLADVAMYYYETDIQPTLDNQVPVMRKDLDGVPSGVFSGPDPKMHQHMKTYAIAFGVAGTVDPGSVPSNPVAAFNWPDPFASSQAKIDDMLHAAINGRGRFLNAGTPQELQAAFESAFLEFTQAASSTSSAAFNSTSLREGTLLYRGFYDLRDNTGELTATVVNTDGSLEPAPQWRASDRLNAVVPNNRIIATFNRTTGAGAAFKYGSLNADQQMTLNAQQVDFIRGDRSNESPTGTLRERPAVDGLLGDIVNSSPVFVGAPRSINRDQSPFPVDDLFSEFVDSVKDRTPVVYVGANDGMMHGFNGLTGDELFSYVPNKILDGTEVYSNKLDQFTSPFYQHNYYVDLTPRLNDVYMRASPAAIGQSWNSVLVGGLGAGGKGFFALNVTDPDTSFSSDANAASTVLWEFTDEDDTYPVDASGNPLGGAVGAYTDPLGKPVKDLGYSVSLPVVAMSNVDGSGSPPNKEWVALFGNGPNSTAGIAKLFVLFMNGGLGGWGANDFVKIDTGVGVPTAPHPLAGFPNGLGTPAAVDRDLNGTVDWVYAGDRLGNLYRFDLTDPDPDNWKSTRLFTATYDDGGTETIQPILTEPLVIKHPTQQGFLVIFGTGSYVTREDADSEDIQSIYAIWDRGAASPATALPDTKRDRLVEQTITNVVDDSVNPPQTRRIVSKNPVNYQLEGADPGTYGWYIDLDMPRATTTLSGGANTDTAGRNPPDAQYPGEKAIRRMLFRDGTVITTTVLPSLDEFSCFGTRPGSILVFDSVTGGDAKRPVVDFNRDGVVDDGDLVDVSGEAFAGGLLFNQSDLDGALVDLSTLGGIGDTDFLFVSGGNETISYRIDDINDSRTGRLSWRELDNN